MQCQWKMVGQKLQRALIGGLVGKGGDAYPKKKVKELPLLLLSLYSPHLPPTPRIANLFEQITNEMRREFMYFFLFVLFLLLRLVLFRLYFIRVFLIFYVSILFAFHSKYF